MGIQPVEQRTFTACMEQLQEGYVWSVAAAAGCLVQPVPRQYYGMDVLLVRPNEVGTQESSVYVQLKSTTTTKPDPAKAHFSYKFKKRQYLEDLAAPRTNPKAILVVMATCPAQQDWVTNGHESLEMRHCCYWVSLEGRAVDPSVASPSVQIPTTNVFNAAALTSILDKVDNGEALSA